MVFLLCRYMNLLMLYICEIVRIVTEAIQDERNLAKQSFTDRFFSWLSNYPNIRHKGKIVEPDAKPGWLARIYFWMGKSKLFDLEITDAVTIKEYSGVVSDLLIKYVDPDYINNYLNVDFKHPVLFVNDHVEDVAKDVATRVVDAVIKVTDQQSSDKVIDQQSSDKLPDLKAGGNGFYHIINCSFKSRIVSVPSDGSCLFHSLIVAASLSLTAPSLRRFLLDSPLLCDHILMN